MEAGRGGDTTFGQAGVFYAGDAQEKVVRGAPKYTQAQRAGKHAKSRSDAEEDLRAREGDRKAKRSDRTRCKEHVIR